MASKNKKTVSVLTLIEIVNRLNKHSTCPVETRKGWNTLLDEVLHKTGNYNGYAYLACQDVPRGELPGIEHTAKFNNYPDVTRRKYNAYSIKK